VLKTFKNPMIYYSFSPASRGFSEKQFLALSSSSLTRV